HLLLLLITMKLITPVPCPLPFFLLHAPATTAIYTLPYTTLFRSSTNPTTVSSAFGLARLLRAENQVETAVATLDRVPNAASELRSEEHTSELQSRFDLVCRLLLEKKKKKTRISLTQEQTHESSIR